MSYISHVKSLIAVVFALLICKSNAFLTPGLQRINLGHSNAKVSIYPSKNAYQRRNGATKLFMSTPASAMDRLSDSTISALTYSQSASQSIGVSTLENEMLIVGMIRATGGDDIEARKVFTQFGVFPDAAQDAAESVLILKGLGKKGGGIIDEAPLPFSDGVKKTLDLAMEIAERMSGSKDGIVLPGHVLLALLEYDDRFKIPVATEDSTNCGGLAVLEKATEIEGATNSNFEATKFCNALAECIKNKNTSETVEVRERQTIIGGDRASSTPTLDKVGTDLTKMAQDGRLDAVWGRDKEIRMCLRTLGRRRKSNPCLIGEPGGKIWF